MSKLVYVDDVLNLFEYSDEDIYAKSTIEDALCNGTLRTVDIPSAEPEERTAKVKNIVHVRGYPPEGECSNCGYDVVDDGEYCPGCGAKLDWSENE